MARRRIVKIVALLGVVAVVAAAAIGVLRIRASARAKAARWFVQAAMRSSDPSSPLDTRVVDFLGPVAKECTREEVVYVLLQAALMRDGGRQSDAFYVTGCYELESKCALGIADLARHSEVNPADRRPEEIIGFIRAHGCSAIRPLARRLMDARWSEVVALLADAAQEAKAPCDRQGANGSEGAESK